MTSTEPWSTRALDAFMNYGPALPLTLCMDSQNRTIRLFGLLWFAVWCLPAMAVCAVPILFLLIADIVMHVYRGDV